MTVSTEPGPVYRDIRDYLVELERRGLLRRITRVTNKDTEVMPLVRWQFRGLAAAQRTGWLFEHLTDSRGRRFDAPVAVAILGASPGVYAAAMASALCADLDHERPRNRCLQRRNLPGYGQSARPARCADAVGPGWACPLGKGPRARAARCNWWAPRPSTC
jgi:hypothetical protein